MAAIFFQGEMSWFDFLRCKWQGILPGFGKSDYKVYPKIFAVILDVSFVVIKLTCG